MSDWIGKIAPLLGNALLGPLGGAAAGFLADKLGVPDKTVEAVTEALNSGKLSADQIASIKVAEIEFQKFLKQNQIDLARLDVENTKSARDMQIAVRSSTPAVLSYIVTVGFFGILIMMLMYPEQRTSEPLLIMLGALGAAFGAVVNFWLGSSHGSSQKSEMLAKAQMPS